MEVNEIQCKYPRISNGNGRLDSAKLGHNQKMDDQYPDEEEERNKKRSNANGGVRGDGVDLADGVGRFYGWPSSRIVRVSRASGGKDRHSKVLTSKGLRDRRVRLSVNTAIQFYDLQDRLGYDQPSKAVEWLLKAAASSIAELPPMNTPFPETPKQLSDDKRSSTGGSDQLGFDSTEVDLDGILLDEPYCTIHFDRYTCSDYSSAGTSPVWDCMKCLKASSPSCGFCSSSMDKLLPGACLISNNTVKDACHGEEREWYPRGCPSRFGWLALIGLALCILFFSSGMGTVPWIVNSEIYPLRFRGICGGITAMANWISSLIVAQSFLSLTEAIGTSKTFLLFGVLSIVALFCFLVCVPETKGLYVEEVAKDAGDESFTVEILGEKI